MISGAELEWERLGPPGPLPQQGGWQWKHAPGPTEDFCSIGGPGGRTHNGAMGRYSQRDALESSNQINGIGGTRVGRTGFLRSTGVDSLCRRREPASGGCSNAGHGMPRDSAPTPSSWSPRAAPVRTTRPSGPAWSRKATIMGSPFTRQPSPNSYPAPTECLHRGTSGYEAPIGRRSNLRG